MASHSRFLFIFIFNVSDINAIVTEFFSTIWKALLIMLCSSCNRVLVCVGRGPRG